MGRTVNPLATLSGVRLPSCPPFFFAQMVELVDTPALEAGIAKCESSNLSLGTIYNIFIYFIFVYSEIIKNN